MSQDDLIMIFFPLELYTYYNILQSFLSLNGLTGPSRALTKDDLTRWLLLWLLICVAGLTPLNATRKVCPLESCTISTLPFCIYSSIVVSRVCKDARIARHSCY